MPGELARLHLNYEHERPWQLDWETADGPVDYRVEKMRPLKRVQSEDGDYRIFDSLQYNDTLTLRGIPAEAFRYRLGTRSALEWVVDQYRVKTDKRSGIVSDPNAWSDDQQYIVNLVGRVLRVSMETVTHRGRPGGPAAPVAIAGPPHPQPLVPLRCGSPAQGEGL